MILAVSILLLLPRQDSVSGHNTQRGSNRVSIYRLLLRLIAVLLLLLWLHLGESVEHAP